LTPEEKAVIDAAKAYYWHNDESVEFHNDLMGAVAALLYRRPKLEDPTDSEVHI
jgi:hypothetical protein